ncbi:GNAT family N-acetyltransferase [Desulfosporosinus youngiae]|uniref:Acetyltransferase n=1 Tax=Desulfosporosinus youngiae DSM 17734 TaxID=768710 RepID=H5XX87_9FIRM|nr:GNAT family N-acetyltransferase [Desulfosporosinus youngiae]EHQ91027.1 acetyltransferase [Desulfosporosinus youngiae DSM 17734]
MIIREGNIAEKNEIMTFYDKMCKILDNSSFLPDGNKGGFPPKEMIVEAIKNKELFVGIKNDCVMAAYIMDHLCDSAYDKVKWQIDADKIEVFILHALRVSPEYGGRGYAKKLVEHAIQIAKQNKQKAIRLDCIEGNDVPQKMYMSYGFKYIDTVGIFYEDIGTEMNFLLFELLL